MQIGRIFWFGTTLQIANSSASLRIARPVISQSMLVWMILVGAAYGRAPLTQGSTPSSSCHHKVPTAEHPHSRGLNFSVLCKSCGN